MREKREDYMKKNKYKIAFKQAHRAVRSLGKENCAFFSLTKKAARKNQHQYVGDFFSRQISREIKFEAMTAALAIQKPLKIPVLTGIDVSLLEERF